MNAKLVNDAVKAKLSLMRVEARIHKQCDKRDELCRAIMRMRSTMTAEERNEYEKRIVA